MARPEEGPEKNGEGLDQGLLKIVGTSGSDEIIAGTSGIAMRSDDVVNVGSGCNPDCTGSPSGIEEYEIDGAGGDDSPEVTGPEGG